jgi:hypothetical protein
MLVGLPCYSPCEAAITLRAHVDEGHRDTDASCKESIGSITSCRRSFQAETFTIGVSCHPAPYQLLSHAAAACVVPHSAMQCAAHHQRTLMEALSAVQQTAQKAPPALQPAAVKLSAYPHPR